MTTNIIELKDVHKAYELGKTTVTALRGVDLTVGPVALGGRVMVAA